MCLLDQQMRLATESVKIMHSRFDPWRSNLDVALSLKLFETFYNIGNRVKEELLKEIKFLQMFKGCDRVIQVMVLILARYVFRLKSRSQSYDRELQRQRCRSLHRC
jgi:hypothetical protein